MSASSVEGAGSKGRPSDFKDADAPALAVVLDAPRALGLRRLAASAVGPEDVAVAVDWSGVSTGTERLLWSGEMPSFPGMGYPLVPGYEAVGRVVAAGPDAGLALGETVFVPGARCFSEARCLFGAAASRLVAPAERVHAVPADLGADGALLALAATAYHALGGSIGTAPSLIVGHGVLGRLLARIALLMSGPAPTVWETNPARRDGAEGYAVVDPAEDPADRRYRLIIDASGDADLLDRLIARLAPGGEIVLAGFYSRRLGFDFAPAFLREARLRVAAEWRPADMRAVVDLAARKRLSLSGLVTHRAPAADAADAYRIAFDDPACLKMMLDWRNAQ